MAKFKPKEFKTDAEIKVAWSKACVAIEKTIYDLLGMDNIAFHLSFADQGKNNDGSIYTIQNKFTDENIAFDLLFGYFAQFVSELSGDNQTIDMKIANELLQEMKEVAVWCAENPSVFRRSVTN